MSKRVLVVGVLLGAMCCFCGCGATPETAESEADSPEITYEGMGLTNQSGLAPFSFGSPDTPAFVPDAPLPEHIDIEALLDKLAPIEPYLIWSIDEMKAFTWGEKRDSIFDERVDLRIEGGNYRFETMNFSFLEDLLRSIFFSSSVLHQEPETPEDPMTQSEFYDLVQKIIAIFELNLEFSPEDCKLMPFFSEEKEWVVRQKFDVAGIPYADCRFNIRAHPKVNALKGIMMHIPDNPPPNLTPVLSKEDAVRRAKSVAFASGYFAASRPSQILLYEEPQLEIVDQPWTLAHHSFQQAKNYWFLKPTVSWESPELRKARLYWSVPLYPNIGPDSDCASVEHLMIDAITGDLLHTFRGSERFEIDPNIPFINPYEFVVMYSFPYWFPILFALVLIGIYTGKFLRRRIRAYRRRKALAV